MELYLARHADALHGSPDAERPLSRRGREEAARVARALAAAGVRPAAIWHSPARRAREMAELLAARTEPAVGLVPRVELASMADPLDVLRLVRPEPGPLLLVGHLPHLERLASRLLTGDPAADIVRIVKGGVLGLESPDGYRWRLDWYVTPELLREDQRAT